MRTVKTLFCCLHAELSLPSPHRPSRDHNEAASHSSRAPALDAGNESASSDRRNRRPRSRARRRCSTPCSGACRPSPPPARTACTPRASTFLTRGPKAIREMIGDDCVPGRCPERWRGNGAFALSRARRIGGMGPRSGSREARSGCRRRHGHRCRFHRRPATSPAKLFWFTPLFSRLGMTFSLNIRMLRR